MTGKNTRQKLIQCSYELFGRNGFHFVGLDQILDEVGISKQTFYNHFQSKDDLILAVLSHRHETESKKWADMFRQFGGTDPRAQLYAIFDILQAWFDEPEFRGCIFLNAAAEFPSHTDPVHQASKEHEFATIEHLQYLATLAGATDPKALAEQLTMLVGGAISYRHVTNDPRAVDIARRLGVMLLDAYLPPVQEQVERSAKGRTPVIAKA